MEDPDRELRQPLLNAVHVASEQADGTLDNDDAQPGTGYGSIGGTEDAEEFVIPESRKIGVAGAVFLILNKMIGTGSMPYTALSNEGLG